MTTLLGSLKDLTGTPAEATESVRSDLDRKGILLLTRDDNLDLLSPASGADTAIVSLDSPARTAAAAAFATLAPQITRYGADANGGVNIWIASAEKNAKPVLLQARIPSSYLASAFKNFVSDGPWSIAVVGKDGEIYAQTTGEAPAAYHTEAVGNPSLIEAFASTAQFDWRIEAGLPSEAVERHTRRNWMTFAAISSLLAFASFTGATMLTWSLLEESHSNNLKQAPRMPSPIDRRTQTQHPPSSGGNPDGDRMRAALKAGNVGVWEWTVQSGLVHWDAEIANIFDGTPGGDKQNARNLVRHIEPHDRRRLLRAIRTSIAASKPLVVEIRVRARDGEVRWIAVRGAATKMKGGEPSRLSGVIIDITDQKLNLSRTDALLREVSHRSKNLLALILAMARLTARDAINVKSHLKDFALRVAGLSASQDLIVASDWQSVDFATLASAEIGAVARTDAGRVAVSGPPLFLTPEAAQTLGMVLTELALNAVEHGALSSATGEVHLSWTFPSDDTVSISWRETGGPPFVVDGPNGYGRSVVERFSTQGLKLAVHAATDHDGFRWTLSGPLANIGTRSERLA
ncbi:sensor histidine kinase [Hyphomicrobium sp.]|uniref:sensor histidine kinase n=1 Tax=Hyphomicrobium sp. TaxID=82 RepID=UPI00356B074D